MSDGISDSQSGSATGRSLNLFISHPSHFLTDTEPHGDGLIAHSLLEQLALRGHRLHVATGLTAVRKPLPANVRLYPVPTRMPHRRDRQPLAYRMEYAVRVRALFRRLHRQEPFDVIHQLNPVVGGLSLLLPGLGCPVLLGPLWSLWEDPSRSAKAGQSLSARLKDRLLAAQFLRANGVLTPTAASDARLPKRLRASGRAYRFPLGIDEQRFQPGPAVRVAQPEAAKDGPVILFLANLQVRKGILVLLEAFEQVASAMPGARLRIGGSGWDEQEVQRRVAASPYRERIEMLGNVAREAVPAALAACDVYCLPSFGEPYGMSALEAMAAGKPLVVTNTGGLAHLVPDSGSLKVPPQNVEALAAALLRLLADSDLQKQLGNSNREHVARHHGWAPVMDRLESVYLELTQRQAVAQIHTQAEVS